VEDGHADVAAELRVVADEGGKDLLLEVSEGGIGIAEAGELLIADGDGEGLDGENQAGGGWRSVEGDDGRIEMIRDGGGDLDEVVAGGGLFEEQRGAAETAGFGLGVEGEGKNR